MKVQEWINVRVARKVEEARNVFSYELVDPAGALLPRFTAGAHIDVHVPGGHVRQYSLCNDPAEMHRYVIGVLRTSPSRGGSDGMHQQVHEGDVLRVSAPRNHFALAEDSSFSVLFAGGIGITPILSMAETLVSTSDAFEMHYCARDTKAAAFQQRIQNSRFSDAVRFHFDNGERSKSLDIGATLARLPPETHLYVCGPQGFMNAVLDTARADGWAESRLHYEYFSAPLRATVESQGGFLVKLASSGKVIEVRSEQSVVEALQVAGVEIPVSCGQGICGTCVTRVLEGVPDHRDQYLLPNEQARNDQFTPCCSRAKTELLVLDL